MPASLDETFLNLPGMPVWQAMAAVEIGKANRALAYLVARIAEMSQ
jgi:hypothetical protein